MKNNIKNGLLEELAYKAYFGSKNGDSYYFNYDIYPLIKEFSFTEFLNTNAKTEHGGILIITDNQYIIGYTAEFGFGTHRAAFARIMKDLTGGGHITDKLEAKKLESKCTKTYITARIVYDYKGNNENQIPIHSGAIYFQLPKDDKITLEQFEMFKQFYEDYNKELEIIIRKYGIDKFNIQFGCLDASGTKIIKTVDSLNEVSKYLERCIDYNKKIDDCNEVILGIPLNNSNYKIKTKKSQ